MGRQKTVTLICSELLHEHNLDSHILELCHMFKGFINNQ